MIKHRMFPKDLGDMIEAFFFDESFRNPKARWTVTRLASVELRARMLETRGPACFGEVANRNTKLKAAAYSRKIVTTLETCRFDGFKHIY